MPSLSRLIVERCYERASLTRRHASQRLRSALYAIEYDDRHVDVIYDGDDDVTSSVTIETVTLDITVTPSLAPPTFTSDPRVQLFGVVLLLFVVAALLGMVYARIWYSENTRHRKLPPKVG